MPTVLVTSGKKIGDAALSQTYSAMSESAGNIRKRYVDRPTGELKYVSYTAPGIHHMNVGSWENLVLSMLKVSLLRTMGSILYQEINLTGSKRIMLLHENQKVSAAEEAHENTESNFDENKLYLINNISLGGRCQPFWSHQAKR